MMSFERNGSVKETMGIGLTEFALPISSIKGELSIHWKNHKGNYKSRDYKLRKRWFIPLKRTTNVMNLSEVPVWQLKLMFRVKTTETDFFEKTWQFLTPWVCIKSRIRKIQKYKRYVEVDLSDKSFKRFNSEGLNSSTLKFTVTSQDPEKAEKINKAAVPLDKVMVGGKVYMINPESKTLC